MHEAPEAVRRPGRSLLSVQRRAPVCQRRATLAAENDYPALPFFTTSPFKVAVTVP